MRSIMELATSLGLRAEDVIPYGHDVAKIRFDAQPGPRRGSLVLVSAITPTPHGEGKTTTAIALGMGLERLGVSNLVCLRQPAMGPYFGRKGGGSGGGEARLEPQRRIDLHFTGDMHAVTSAHDLVASLVDHALHVGATHRSGRRLDARRIVFPRVLDVDDRALRHVVVGLGGRLDGVPREARFEITAASELMAILCLARDRDDLRARLGRVVIGADVDGALVDVDELGATDAALALLWDAFDPNLVQTCEGSPALVHGGPFANVAHGCSSIAATELALRLSDVVVTEAGFDFALGGEKFLHLVCPAGGFAPKVVVLVATARALAHHGLGNERPLEAGLENLRRHVANVRRIGREPIVCLNVFAGDAEDDLRTVETCCAELGLVVRRCTAFVDGGHGAEALAAAVVEATRTPDAPLVPLHPPDATYRAKVHAIATLFYGARDVAFGNDTGPRLEALDRSHPGLGVCVAKTPDSFSDDPRSGGLAKDFVPTVTDVSLSAGAGFVVVRMGPIATMPGLPRRAAAFRVRVARDGAIHLADDDGDATGTPLK